MNGETFIIYFFIIWLLIGFITSIVLIYLQGYLRVKDLEAIFYFTLIGPFMLLILIYMRYEETIKENEKKYGKLKDRYIWRSKRVQPDDTVLRKTR